MSRRPKVDCRGGGERRHSRAVLSRPTRNAIELGHRARGTAAGSKPGPFFAPEDWHEPSGDATLRYRIVVQEPGPGYSHVVTARQIRDRLSALPNRYLEPLQVVQLSRMTHKKERFPCYGMQWGSAIYLYPVEDGLAEQFSRPPRPAEYQEARAFGGRWVQKGASWCLVWTPQAIRDFYLDNVLLHELGHLLDNRNTNFRDRERFAEWFAIRHRNRGEAAVE